MTRLEPGRKAPTFTLLDQDGHKVSLRDFQGQKVLLFFYPRANTPGCTKQACSVQEALPELADLGVVSLGISPDTPDQQKKFAGKQGLSFPLLADGDHRVAKAYGAWGVKNLYGRQSEGIIRSAFLLDEEGRVLQSWYKVKPLDTVPKARAALSGG